MLLRQSYNFLLFLFFICFCSLLSFCFALDSLLQLVFPLLLNFVVGCLRYLLAQARFGQFRRENLSLLWPVYCGLLYHLFLQFLKVV